MICIAHDDEFEMCVNQTTYIVSFKKAESKLRTCLFIFMHALQAIVFVQKLKYYHHG